MYSLLREVRGSTPGKRGNAVKKELLRKENCVKLLTVNGSEMFINDLLLAHSQFWGFSFS